MAPGSRVVYVDNDPMVLAHARTILDAEGSGEVHYVDALPSGSFLALCDGTSTSEPMIEAARRWNEVAAIPYHLRTPKEIEGFFEGLGLLEPGVVSANLWRPCDSETDTLTEVDQYCGVARTP
ncbi:hypothetical protein BQ8420_19620 [Nocardiopsis sp. JB363]|nr:hypothetical protein BQ8420_19620 [Nocardiopsis sp. JB363]